MSGGKVSGSQQHEDTAVNAALLALHFTLREATLLFAMAEERTVVSVHLEDSQDQRGERGFGGASAICKAVAPCLAVRGAANRSHTGSPLTPLQQLWEPSQQMIGGGLGRQTGRSC
jgi:hypothetical protein